MNSRIAKLIWSTLVVLSLLACGRQGFEQQQTPCTGIDCSGHGKCVVSDGQAVCICDQGYQAQGTECLEESNPCLGITCSGYGTCAVRQGEAWCVCAEGYHNEGRTNCVADEHTCQGADGSPCDDGQFCTVDDRCNGGVCAGVANPCDDGNSCTVDTCNEIEDQCVNTPAPDGVPCDDADFCTIGEVCAAGTCQGGVPRNCADGNPCTEDLCDSAAGVCNNQPLADGTSCDDGAWCTEGETCSAGQCGGGSLRDCADDNSCTTDVCDESSDTCQHVPVADDSPCDDGQFCTVNDTCQGGGCVGGPSRDCSDGDQCTADACDDDLDQCLHSAAPDGTVCNDGDFCTVGESCSAGTCSGGQARNCADGNPCTIDGCDSQAGTCTHVVAGDGTSCDDGLYCTVNDACWGGVCGGTARDCDDGNPCTLDSCDDSSASCVHDTSAMDGAGCDDGLFCTVADVCSGGTCSGQANSCDDGNPCTNDSCDEDNNQCRNTPANDGAACDDGLWCTVGDTCAGGVCSGSNRDCSDGNVCTADSCNEVADSCNNIAVPDGTGCDDGLYCTVGETCSGGSCGGGMPRNCTDGNQCTVDTCDEDNDTCSSDAAAADGQPCDDGAWCTVGETCSGGSCSGGAARDCDDGNACTTDVCNEGADSCDHPAVIDGTPCDDGQFCTVSDTCSGGVCGGSPNPCDDANPCTNDVCDEINDQCTATPVTDGTPCDDGAWCTVGETCNAGTCSGGLARNCSDGSPCTVDSCDEDNDLCVNTPANEGTPCDDGAWCTVGETCTGGVCGGGSMRDCDDGDVCTTDVCDESQDQCLHDVGAANGTACDDGDPCTVSDTCFAGACSGVAKNCSDGNPCTVDSCNPVDGSCVNDAAAADGLACNDGAFCTVNDTCSGGSCSGGSARDCSDGNGCTIDSCDEINDICINDAAAADGNACDDGLFCNVGEQCSNGACLGGSPRNCSDGDQCTVDSCDESNDVCVNDAAAADGNACDDGQFCTVGETCSGGSCSGGSPRNCSDGNDCTVDSCDETGDTCTNDTAAADGNACDDGSFCTVGETCSGGFCSGGSARNCADGNPCTADSCNEATDQCDNTPVGDGTGCDDGSFCTVGETCTGGVCGGGAARDCSDGNQCTADSCDDTADVCINDAAAADGQACDDGLYCVIGETCSSGVCGGGTPRTCDDSTFCTLDSCDESAGACSYDAAAMNGTGCDDGNFCIVGETCNAGSCGGGSLRNCDDAEQCTVDSCDETNDVCVNDAAAADGNACDDGLFCTSGDQCSGGVCQSGTANPCTTDNPCASGCDEATDSCTGCSPAGTVCKNATQEATCDGACNVTQLVICQYGCNLVRDECNECSPSTTECKGDATLLCNAEFVCDADGLLQSVTCCSTNRCSCDGSGCLEDVCLAGQDVSAGGSFSGSTCDDYDHIPGDCNPGGTACRDTGSGGAPEEMFLFTLDDGTADSAFYTVDMDTAGSAIDTGLRASRICGSETSYIPYAEVCTGPVGTTFRESCSQEAGAEAMTLCGLPEGTYFGAVESPAGVCGNWNMTVGVTQVTLDTAPEAGNVSMGGTFLGNTCNLADSNPPGLDEYFFPDKTAWAIGSSDCPASDCVFNGPNSADCPKCSVTAANDCTLLPNYPDDYCTFDGSGSPDAVFYLALPIDSGVDISTKGSDFDTVLYIMETGIDGAQDPSNPQAGTVRVCNDDCWTSDGPSHIQTTLAAGLYYVYLDGANGACGNFVLKVVISPAANCGNLVCEGPYENCGNCPQDCLCPNCGDGTLQEWEGEECDDGDTASGDCCADVCYVESGCHCCGEPSVCTSTFSNVDQTSSPAAAIPDCSTGGGAGTPCDATDYGTLTDTITVPGSCLVVDINVDVDITHTWRGDLSLELTSPDGTTVGLKQKDGSDGANDVIGNFDLTLPVEGPGSLDDFECDTGNGTWTLTIHDWYKGDTGTLNSWALHLVCQ